MSNVERGKLILKEVPAGEVEKKVVMLLSKFATNTSIEELTEKVRNTPYALSNDVAAEKAVLILEAFQKYGATAVFIPHMTEKPEAEPFTPVQSRMDTSFAFHPTPDLEEEPSPVQPVVKKNGRRRLTMTLVVILLLLSMGYLAWQLWPVLGDKILEWWSYLKQLI